MGVPEFMYRAAIFFGGLALPAAAVAQECNPIATGETPFTFVSSTAKVKTVADASSVAGAAIAANICNRTVGTVVTIQGRQITGNECYTHLGPKIVATHVSGGTARLTYCIVGAFK